MSAATATSDQIKAAATALTGAMRQTGALASLLNDPTTFVTKAVASALPNFTAAQLQQLGTEVARLTTLDASGNPVSGSAASGSALPGKTISGSSDLPYILQCPQDCMLCIFAILLACVALGLLLNAAGNAEGIYDAIILGRPGTGSVKAAETSGAIGLAVLSLAALAMLLCLRLESSCVGIG